MVAGGEVNPPNANSQSSNSHASGRRPSRRHTDIRSPPILEPDGDDFDETQILEPVMRRARKGKNKMTENEADGEQEYLQPHQVADFWTYQEFPGADVLLPSVEGFNPPLSIQPSSTQPIHEVDVPQFTEELPVNSTPVPTSVPVLPQDELYTDSIAPDYANLIHTESFLSGPVLHYPSPESGHQLHSHDPYFLYSMLPPPITRTNDVSTLLETVRLNYSKTFTKHSKPSKGKSSNFDSSSSSRTARRRPIESDDGLSSGTEESLEFEIPPPIPETLRQEFLAELLHAFNKFKGRNGSIQNTTAQPSSAQPTTATATPVQQGSPVVPRRHGKGKRKRGREDEDNDRLPPLRPLPSPYSPQEHLRLFACPFCKRKPLRHPNCRTKVLKEISRVKMHLDRCHTIPIYCPRCSEVFSTVSERDTHNLDCQERRAPKIWEYVTDDQRKKLKKRSDNRKTKEEQWNDIYATLFPGEPLPKSPYNEGIPSAELLKLQSFMADEGTPLLNELVKKHLPHTVQEHGPLIESLFEDFIGLLFEKFEANRQSGSSPDSQPSSNNASEENTTPTDTLNDDGGMLDTSFLDWDPNSFRFIGDGDLIGGINFDSLGYLNFPSPEKDHNVLDPSTSAMP